MWEGIDELDQSFNIYPNPSSGEIMVDLTSIPGQQTFVISDINGKIIRNDKIIGGSQISFSFELEPGVYMISLIDNEGMIRRSKMIIE